MVMGSRGILGRVLAGVLWATAAVAVPIRDIRVEPVGEVPVNAEQVLAQVGVRVGQELDRAALSDDIRALQRSGVYSYAEARVESVDEEGMVLILRVSGRAKIRELKISGADYLGNKKVRNLLEIGSGEPVDNALLGQKSQKVRESYRKEFFPDAKLTWELRPVEGGREFTDVDIQVEEGRRAVVRRIRFNGNRHVRAKELRKVMKQKQSTWLTWINNDGIYEPGYVLTDREALRKVFMDKGYLGATVGEPSFVYVGKKKIDITFEVVEGPVYRLDQWRILGMTLFPTNEVSRGVVALSGGEASLDAIQRSAQNIRDYYGSRGYIKTAVDPRISLDTNAATAAVSYQAFWRTTAISGISS